MHILKIIHKLEATKPMKNYNFDLLARNYIKNEDNSEIVTDVDT